MLLDRDVAELYGVETKRVNEAVRNNPDKFPDRYLLRLTKEEKKELVENFDRVESWAVAIRNDYGDAFASAQLNSDQPYFGSTDVFGRVY